MFVLQATTKHQLKKCVLVKEVQNKTRVRHFVYTTGLLLIASRSARRAVMR